MNVEQIASVWCDEHPDATRQEAFIAGLGYKGKLDEGAIDKRKDKFRAEVLLYRGQYPDEMLKEFYEYWTECGGRKMRYEKEKTFEVSKRLARWANNNINKYGNKYHQIPANPNSPSARKESVEQFAFLAEGVLQGLGSNVDK